jgi:hypothetical protein
MDIICKVRQMIYWCLEEAIALVNFFTLEKVAHTYGVFFIMNVILCVSD